MKRLFFMAAILTVLAGCGRGPRPGGEADQSVGTWETAWIDPVVVAGDERYTLIRSARIDSFQVEPEAQVMVPALRFDLPDGQCLVSINVVDDTYRVVMPLVVQKLGPGFYKISIQPSQLLARGLLPGSYALQAEYCGVVDNAPFELQ
jgi:hypothetical protein